MVEWLSENWLALSGLVTAIAAAGFTAWTAVAAKHANRIASEANAKSDAANEIAGEANKIALEHLAYSTALRWSLTLEPQPDTHFRVPIVWKLKSTGQYVATDIRALFSFDTSSVFHHPLEFSRHAPEDEALTIRADYDSSKYRKITLEHASAIVEWNDPHGVRRSQEISLLPFSPDRYAPVEAPSTEP